VGEGGDGSSRRNFLGVFHGLPGQSHLYSASCLVAPPCSGHFSVLLPWALVRPSSPPIRSRLSALPIPPLFFMDFLLTSCFPTRMWSSDGGGGLYLSFYFIEKIMFHQEQVTIRSFLSSPYQLNGWRSKMPGERTKGSWLLVHTDMFDFKRIATIVPL
jgi:hypothetical protein